MQRIEAGFRVATGVVRFDADWPGCFLRGDDALYHAKMLERALASLNPEHVAAAAKDIIAILRECQSPPLP